jgi:hypothetical protein
MPEHTEETAVRELVRLTSDERARRNFDAFADVGRFPWEWSRPADVCVTTRREQL